MQALHDPTTCDYDSTHDDYSVNLTLSGMPPFDAPITFHFRHRVNILAGPNGCGKSTALARLAGQPLPAWLASSFDPASRHPDLEPQDFFAGKPTVFIASTRTELDSQSIANYVRQVKNDSFVGRMLSYKNIMFFAMAVIVDICLVWILQYGSLDADMQTLPTLMIVYAAIINIFVIVNIIPFAAIYRAKRQIILKRDLSRILGHRANETSIFLSEGVQRAMRLLLGTNRRPKQGNMAEAATRAADLAYACAKGIAPEMFPEDGRSDTQVLKAADSFWLRRWDPFGQIRQHMFALDTRFSDQKLHPMYLSSGSQGPLMFIWYLALTMAHRYDFEGDWENKPAVLFIDEVENHLHPTWQRRVIPTLLEHFPRLQIFATTHSPFVLAGLKSGQIHRMYRDHEGFVRVHTIDEDTIGWRAEELLTTFMEIDDPTDLETATAAATLRWLRYESPSEGTAEEWRQAAILRLIDPHPRTRDEEAALSWLSRQDPLVGESMQWREQRINELRYVVSRELESRGTIPAQGELFYERLIELLDSGELDHLGNED